MKWVLMPDGSYRHPQHVNLEPGHSCEGVPRHPDWQQRPCGARIPDNCELPDCTGYAYTAIVTTDLPLKLWESLGRPEGLRLCRNHYKQLRTRHGRVMGYRQKRNGKTVAYVQEELF